VVVNSELPNRTYIIVAENHDTVRRAATREAPTRGAMTGVLRKGTGGRRQVASIRNIMEGGAGEPLLL
jgi:hypothetical protein